MKKGILTAGVAALLSAASINVIAAPVAEMPTSVIAPTTRARAVQVLKGTKFVNIMNTPAGQKIVTGLQMMSEPTLKSIEYVRDNRRAKIDHKLFNNMIEARAAVGTTAQDLAESTYLATLDYDATVAVKQNYGTAKLNFANWYGKIAELAKTKASSVNALLDQLVGKMHDFKFMEKFQPAFNGNCPLEGATAAAN